MFKNMNTKTFQKLISLLAVLCLIVSVFAGCDGKDTDTQKTDGSSTVDYVAETKLNLKSETKKQEVTVKSFIDGDTTHFFVPESISADGVLKARYMGVNTPESTGKIEEWGKKASLFTRGKLEKATSIIVESDNDQWNVDSTGGRHLVWVWYKTADSEDYRCLNLELIQNGLSISCGTTADRYGTAASNAFQQAKAQKLHVFSGAKDPDFFYGDAYEVDLKGLRTNISLYDNAKVAFEGVITRNNNNSVYVESYDAETDMYYGMSVYYGYETGALLNILKVGNRVRVVGTVTYYETGGTWQVSGLSYREFKPNDPSNTIMISEGNSAANKETSPELFTRGTLDIETMNALNSEETTVKTFEYANLAMSTSISMKNLKVKSIYTTHNGGDSDGAMTLSCEANGLPIDVRTIVLYDDNGRLLTEADFLNKTIDVTGIVDYFSGAYQIKVFSAKDIIVR
ncbi:MAG: thermonuclease family protein [Ruminococcaceae bacterium]|nr:thermonuclease family protein [Oscillospiraceae bacterium]